MMLCSSEVKAGIAHSTFELNGEGWQESLVNNRHAAGDKCSVPRATHSCWPVTNDRNQPEVVPGMPIFQEIQSGKGCCGQVFNMTYTVISMTNITFYYYTQPHCSGNYIGSRFQSESGSGCVCWPTAASPALPLTTLLRPFVQSLAVAHVNTSVLPRRQPYWDHPRVVRLSVIGHSQ